MVVVSPSGPAVDKTQMTLVSLPPLKREAKLRTYLTLSGVLEEQYMGGRGGQKKKEIDNTKYYTLLGATKDNTQDEIKKSFRKIALKEHPDKGGDPEKVGILGL